MSVSINMNIMVIDSTPSRGGDQWTGLPDRLSSETTEDYRDRLISWVAERIAKGGYGVSDAEHLVYREGSDIPDDDVIATVMVDGFPDARLYESSKIR